MSVLKPSISNAVLEGVVITSVEEIGKISMFSGDISIFPTATHAMCDGNNGTPDLRGQFIRGWSDAVGQEYGGSPARRDNTQTASVKPDGMSVSSTKPFGDNSLPNGTFDSWEGASPGDVSVPGSGAFIPKFGGGSWGEGNHTHTVNGTGNETRPKNFALAFIMRVA